MDEKTEEQKQISELEAMAESAEREETVTGEWEPGPEPGQSGPAPGQKTADILAPMLQITFGLIAAKRGAHWALTDEEANEAGRAYGDVIDKYFPETAVGPEVTAILVTLVLVGPRVGEDKRREVAAAAAADREQEKRGERHGDSSE